MHDLRWIGSFFSVWFGISVSGLNRSGGDLNHRAGAGPSIVALYKRGSVLSKSETQLFERLQKDEVESVLNKQDDLVYLKIDREKPWYVVMPLASSDSFSQREIPSLVKLIFDSEKPVRLSDLPPAPRESLQSQLTVSNQPFFGPNTVLHASIDLIAEVEINGKTIYPIITSKQAGDSPSSGTSNNFSTEQWNKLIKQRESMSELETKSLKSMSFIFHRVVPTKERLEFFKVAASSLEALIQKRDEMVARNWSRDFVPYVPDFPKFGSAGLKFDDLDAQSQKNLLSQIMGSRDFPNEESAKAWMQRKTSLTLSLRLSVGVPGVSLALRLKLP
jgi:hypothetical protein